jgi:hypothetical protein
VLHLDLLDVHPIDVNFKETYTCSDDESLLAAGCAYESGSLMTMHGSLYMKRVNMFLRVSLCLRFAVDLIATFFT